eukprot:CAMPEP_0172831982 /NCGR_PEP_ID=MMETSP1075-20121228/23349_1 /TAXON_ID=2916 /ORGANISM="Ceratium fusus, Strain PA161109" /LENGTH=219 /DNA_ID=CAMNT_0013674523 /DNA_START=183 /DNA_END=843 /DNA_ORIENTATION=+
MTSQSSKKATEGTHPMFHVQTGDERTGNAGSLLSGHCHSDNCEYHYIGSVRNLECTSAKSVSPSVKRHKEVSPLRIASARQSARPKCHSRRASHWMSTPPAKSQSNHDEGPGMLTGTPQCEGPEILTGTPRSDRNHWMLNSLLPQENEFHAGRAGRVGNASHWLLTPPRHLEYISMQHAPGVAGSGGSIVMQLYGAKQQLPSTPCGGPYSALASRPCTT